MLVFKKSLGGIMQNLMQDIRHSLRLLIKNRVFTLTAILTLALGIGANSAFFSVIDSVLFRPLPYKDPERIVYLWGTNKKDSNDRNEASLPDYQDWKEQGRQFVAMGAYGFRAYNLSGDQRPEAVQGAMVSSGFLEAIGVEPIVGRRFGPDEERQNLVILGHALWQRRFGSDPGIIGQSVKMSSESYTVIGVMPPGFNFPRKDVEAWTTFSFFRGAPRYQNRGARVLAVIGRLGPGVSIEQARSEMNGVVGRLGQQYPDTNTGVGINLVPISDELLGKSRPTLLFVWAMIGLVLLIACANLAGLLVARAAARGRELAIRTAMGASRLRLIRQLLTESITLSVVGGALGLLVAFVSVDLLVKLSPPDLPRIDSITLDVRWVLFTFALSLLTGVLVGLIPAVQASKHDLVRSLKEGGKNSAGGAPQRRLGNLLTVSEMALSLMLLIGAGLMISSFQRLNTVNLGFEPQNVMTMYIAFARQKYPQPQQQMEYFERLLQQLGQTPMVQEAALGYSLPPNLLYSRESFSIEGQTEAGAKSLPSGDYLPVSSRYFRALKVPLLKGREFTEADRADSPRVVIINQTLAKSFSANEDPIGKRIIMGDPDSEDSKYTIVGIVGDVKYNGLSRNAGPQLYFPYTQHSIGGAFFLVRTSVPPQSMMEPIRKAIYSTDYEQPLRDVKTLDELFSESIAQTRFSMLLLNIFAAAALALSCIGLYGLIAYSITQRTREIGVRLALGADRRDVLVMVLKQGLKLAILGAVIGSIAALAAARLITHLLFGVSATDPIVFSGAVLSLAIAALLACLIPAIRATKIDPKTALREE
jgi:putative ABC transport system permease protein